MEKQEKHKSSLLQFLLVMGTVLVVVLIIVLWDFSFGRHSEDNSKLSYSLNVDFDEIHIGDFVKYDGNWVPVRFIDYGENKKVSSIFIKTSGKPFSIKEDVFKKNVTGVVRRGYDLFLWDSLAVMYIQYN